ncbi:MAG: PRC and DUF2382 domain-containing protein [Mycobacteriales bacterium]
MSTPNDVQNTIGRTAVDAAGEKIGTVQQVYLDDRTGQPAWLTISTGLFGTKESFAPFQGAHADGENVALAVPKDLVKDAPRIDADGDLTDEEVAMLYEHYQGVFAPPAGAGTRRDRRGQDKSGPTTDDAMTRSEEQLHVGTEQVPSGRARLRKYVVTENVSTTVPVSHEEVRVEREPITEANREAAMTGTDISEEEHEVTLSSERPAVEKETVPVERVRLDTETVTEEQTITDEVRKERIDEPDVDNHGDR